jgi:Ran-binding protein 1
MPGTKLQVHGGSDKAWVWSTVDFSEGAQKVELFCMRFGDVDKAQAFKKKFEEAMDINAASIDMAAVATAGAKSEGAAAADALAGEVAAKASVQ